MDGDPARVTPARGTTSGPPPRIDPRGLQLCTRPGGVPDPGSGTRRIDWIEARLRPRAAGAGLLCPRPPSPNPHEAPGQPLPRGAPRGCPQLRRAVRSAQAGTRGSAGHLGNHAARGNVQSWLRPHRTRAGRASPPSNVFNREDDQLPTRSLCPPCLRACTSSGAHERQTCDGARVRPDPDAARSRHARPGSRDRVSETASQERSDPPHPGPLHGSGRAWGGAYPARLSPPGRDAPGRPAGGGGSRRRQAGLRHGTDRAQTSRPRPPDPGLESPFGGVFRSKSAPGVHVPGFVSLKREAQFPPHHEGCGRRHLCPRRSARGS